MKWCIAVIVLLRTATVYAYHCSECLEEVATLKAEIKALSAHVMKLTAMVADLPKAAVEGKSASFEQSTASAAKTSERFLSTNQTGSATERRLSTSLAAVPSIQVHEFPDSCPNADGSSKVLLTMESGAPMYEPSPTNPDSTISLASIGTGWEINEIQQFEAPFKLVHSDCSTAPTLHLPLNTNIPGSLTVDGSLTVGGTDVNADVVWEAITLRAGMSPKESNPASAPSCAVKNGLVFLKGSLQKDAGAWTQTEPFGNLPAACTPTVSRIFLLAQHSGYWARIYMNNAGDFYHDISSHPATGSANDLYLDGAVFAKD